LVSALGQISGPLVSRPDGALGFRAGRIALLGLLGYCWPYYFLKLF
jgi:hypothetical protein